MKNLFAPWEPEFGLKSSEFWMIQQEFLSTIYFGSICQVKRDGQQVTLWTIISNLIFQDLSSDQFDNSINSLDNENILLDIEKFYSYVYMQLFPDL